MSGTADSTGVEVEGATVDEAVDGALSSLGARRDEVDVEILSTASRGLFGLGGRRARVRVTRRNPSQSLAAAALHRVEPRSPVPSRKERALSSAAPDLAEHARAMLEDLVRRMGFASTVRMEAGEDSTLLEISGDNTSVLIGKHGQTLDALEYVLNRIVGREEEASTRIHLDCEQYRVKRQHSLEQLAQKLGDEAKRKGRSITLDPMSPRDRRIVHLALQGDPALTTRSSGEGYFRTLVIIPGSGDRREGRSRAR